MLCVTLWFANCRAQLEGDQGLAVAPFYYEYGNVLVHLKQQQSDFLGSATEAAGKRKAEAQVAAVGRQVGGGDGEGDEEDADDMQIAWEVLELARVVYARSPNKAHVVELAKVHGRLGDLAMENEQFEQAMTEFNKCFELQKKELSPGDRRLAGSHSDLAQACLYDQKPELAMEHYKLAGQVFETHLIEQLAAIKRKTASVSTECTTDVATLGTGPQPAQLVPLELAVFFCEVFEKDFFCNQAEVEKVYSDIKKILADVDETKEILKELEERVAELQDGLQAEAADPSSSSSSSSGPVPFGAEASDPFGMGSIEGSGTANFLAKLLAAQSGGSPGAPGESSSSSSSSSSSFGVTSIGFGKSSSKHQPALSADSFTSSSSSSNPFPSSSFSSSSTNVISVPNVKRKRKIAPNTDDAPKTEVSLETDSKKQKKKVSFSE